MCAQSTRPSRIAQPAGPHRSAHVPIRPDPPRRGGRPFLASLVGPAQIPVNDEGRRRGPAAFDRTALRKRAGSTPAVTGLDDQGRACERHQCQDDPDGLSLEDSLHGHQSHRIPAPTVRAIDARSISAQVKRARFAFTDIPLPTGFGSPLDRRPGGLGEIPGFASPPRGGFALDDRSSGRTKCPFIGTVRGRPGVGP
jgi:hypothetical protein